MKWNRAIRIHVKTMENVLLTEMYIVANVRVTSQAGKYNRKNIEYPLFLSCPFNAIIAWIWYDSFPLGFVRWLCAKWSRAFSENVNSRPPRSKFVVMQLWFSVDVR